LRAPGFFFAELFVAELFLALEAPVDFLRAGISE
jgi:hypothetical protein